MQRQERHPSGADHKRCHGRYTPAWSQLGQTFETNTLSAHFGFVPYSRGMGPTEFPSIGERTVTCGTYVDWSKKVVESQKGLDCLISREVTQSQKDKASILPRVWNRACSIHVNKEAHVYVGTARLIEKRTGEKGWASAGVRKDKMQAKGTEVVKEDGKLAGFRVSTLTWISRLR